MGSFPGSGSRRRQGPGWGSESEFQGLPETAPGGDPVCLMGAEQGNARLREGAAFYRKEGEGAPMLDAMLFLDHNSS